MTDDAIDIAAAKARASQLLHDGFEPTTEEMAEAELLKDSVAALGPEKSIRGIAAMLRAIWEMEAKSQGSAKIRPYDSARLRQYSSKSSEQDLPFFKSIFKSLSGLSNSCNICDFII